MIFKIYTYFRTFSFSLCILFIDCANFWLFLNYLYCLSYNFQKNVFPSEFSNFRGVPLDYQERIRVVRPDTAWNPPPTLAGGSGPRGWTSQKPTGEPNITGKK